MKRTFGYHIAHYAYPGVAARDLFGAVVAQARAADDGGFDRLHVMDHLYQLEPGGRPHDPMFESSTMLAALAQHTSRLDVAALVTGNSYRNPALVAKIVTTLDHVSGGRAQLGMGAGWYELEHEAFGYDFDTAGKRLDRLDEALSIIRQMIDERPEPVSYEGEHYRTVGVVNSPAPSRRIPIIVGGSGERRTLRLVAQHADESNLLGPADESPQKLAALARHCDELGRDRAEIRVTHLSRVCVAPTMEQAHADLVGFVSAAGGDEGALAAARHHLVVGDADTVGEELERRLSLGLDGLALSLNANAHLPERVALLADVVDRLR